MKLSDQCVSLELAKKLKSLNVKQDSYFCWFVLVGIGTARLRNNEWRPEVSGEEPISAFSVSELGDMLPSIVWGESASESSYSLNIYKPNENWHINYSSGHKTKIVYYAKTLADCMAGILICLITMGIIKND